MVTLLDRPAGINRPTRQDILQTLLMRRGWGWSVFPVGPDKKPLCRIAPLRHQRPSDAKLARLTYDCRAGDVRGIGVIPGRISGGLGVADFDSVAGYERWANRRPYLAARLPTDVTRRGQHVYHTSPLETFRQFPRGGWRGPGDYRSDRGHYVVTPGSWHDHGHLYDWLGHLGHTPRDFPLIDPIAADLMPLATEHATDRQSRGTEGKDVLCHPSNMPVRALDDVDGMTDLSGVVQLAVRRCQPWGPGVRNDCLFELCGHLKGIEPGVRADEWEDAVRCWWRLARPRIRTQDWAVTWSDFQRQWAIRRRASGDGRAGHLFALARKRPGSSADRLVWLCGQLSGLARDGVFYLPCRKVGAEALGISYQKSADLIRRLVDRSVLAVVARGGYRRGASHYRLLSTLSVHTSDSSNLHQLEM